MCSVLGVGLVQSPVAMVQSPVAVVQSPVAMVRSPVAVVQKSLEPHGLASCTRLDDIPQLMDGVHSEQVELDKDLHPEVNELMVARQVPACIYQSHL